MDLLRFLMTLPVRLANFIARLFAGLGPALKTIFGNVSWTPPQWMPRLAAAVRRKPQEYAGGTLAVLAALALGWAGWQWYLHLPHPPEPPRITFEAMAPAITDYERSDGTPAVLVHPLQVKFSGSAAPIELVGKKVTRGISTDPAIKGVWTWIDDRTLEFRPATDWPIGAHIEVRFDVAQAFAPHVLMADDHCDFDIQPFAVTAGTGEFYQDPQNPDGQENHHAAHLQLSRRSCGIREAHLARAERPRQGHGDPAQIHRHLRCCQDEGVDSFPAARSAARRRHGGDDARQRGEEFARRRSHIVPGQDGGARARALQPHRVRGDAHACRQRQIRARTGRCHQHERHGQRRGPCKPGEGLGSAQAQTGREAAQRRSRHIPGPFPKSATMSFVSPRR